MCRCDASNLHPRRVRAIFKGYKEGGADGIKYKKDMFRPPPGGEVESSNFYQIALFCIEKAPAAPYAQEFFCPGT